MSRIKLPGRGSVILWGVVSALVFVVFLGLFSFSLCQHGRFINDLLNYEPLSTEAYVLDFGDANNGTYLNEAGTNVACRTCLVTAFGFVGSGFLLRSNLMVTAQHVVDHLEDEVWDVYCPCGPNPQQPLEGRIVAFEPVSDTAFLQVVGALPENAPPLQLSLAEMEPLTPLHIFGYQENADSSGGADLVGKHHATSYIGRTNVTHNRLKNTPVLALAGMAVQGNSGGPIFNDEGQIVGMTVIIWYPRNVTLAISAATIHGLMAKNNL
jgi:hypothetical protein